MAAVILSHKIELDPTEKQKEYFRKACGVARFAYNWALTEWKKQYESGGKPVEGKLRKQLNAIKRTEFPWMMEVSKSAPAAAIMNLGNAYQNFFLDLQKFKAGKIDRKSIRKPKYKKKGKTDSFYVANDRLSTTKSHIRIPVIGWVRIREPLRLHGKIMSATVSSKAGR